MRNAYKNTISVSCLLLLASCASTPPQQKTESAVKEATRSEVGITPQDWAERSVGGPVEVDWIGAFQDSTLAELVKEAQASNK